MFYRASAALSLRSKSRAGRFGLSVDSLSHYHLRLVSGIRGFSVRSAPARVEGWRGSTSSRMWPERSGFKGGTVKVDGVLPLCQPGLKVGESLEMGESNHSLEELVVESDHFVLLFAILIVAQSHTGGSARYLEMLVCGGRLTFVVSLSDFAA
jgi:hypothetical protein